MLSATESVTAAAAGVLVSASGASSLAEHAAKVKIAAIRARRFIVTPGTVAKVAPCSHLVRTTPEVSLPESVLNDGTNGESTISGPVVNSQVTEL